MPRLPSFLRLLALTLVVATATATATATALTAQPRAVDGRVRRPVNVNADSTGMGPAAGTWVTLHRVGKDTAGPIDSVRTDAQGHYRFRYTPFGSGDGVYFASTTWGGIAYFTPPLKNAESRGDDAEITVFDTTSVRFQLTVKGRHFIVGKSDTTQFRTVIEVFELSNDSLRTLVATDTTSPMPTWSIAIPASALDVRANDGEISPDAFVAGPGRVSVYSPIAPGIKQVAFSYKVPNSSFPLSMRAEGGAVVFEVLLEEPQGFVTGKGFANVDPVALEGRTFRRFLSQDVQPNAELIIELPSSGAPARNLYIAGLLVAIGLLMMVVLMRSMQRRAASRVAVEPTMRPRESDAPWHERLAQEIAALDETYARIAEPSDTVKQAYNTRRTELKGALAAALADLGTRR
ncbi:hypothetical protein [Gemmatimonas sp.]|uniref:hypothetical protein n=1 Tax=Gemmatimonas sp. TaxID=1962908 RepID=UPI0039833CE3